MAERPRLELTAGLIVLMLCAAFVASFAFGIGGGSTAGDNAAMADVPPARGRIEVLNGSGRGGMARAATGALRDAGFDVVYFGNASERVDSTVVLSRVSTDRVARAGADELGVRRVRSEPDTTLLLDATVILGPDWTPGRR